MKITREGKYHAEHYAAMYADLARAAGCTDIKWWLSDEADSAGNITIQMTWTPPKIVVYLLDNSNELKRMIEEKREEIVL